MTKTQLTELSDKQLAARLIRAINGGSSSRAYCDRVGWDYNRVYYRLVRSGDWSRVMAAKYQEASR
ncbi:MAG TPA: hypothetical protein VGM37_01215 [Armatimonadota bacterium]|jgi:hypothetical protein